MNFSIWSALWTCYYLVVILAVENILRTKREPRGMIAWILAMIFLPFVGMIAYMLVGPVPMQRKVRRRVSRRRLIAAALAEKKAMLADRHNVGDPAVLDQRTRGLVNLAGKLSDAVVTRDNGVIVHHDPEKAFLNHSLAIEAAEHHVHMEYYIYRPDDTGCAMCALLEEKVKQGVEVRLLLDAVGCWALPRRFVREMKAKGIQVEFFLPWGFTTRRFQLNCRNHRKMTVVDGKRAFTGSKNIADEYLGRKKKLGPWRDTYMEMQGPCVLQMQGVFVEDWHFATKQDLSAATYFPPPEVAGNQVIQVVPSGPDGRSDVMHQLLNAAVADADKSVSIVTPYFVPDRAMLLALTGAAYRGLSVKLLLPSKSDNWLVLWAGRTFYEDLLEAGVELYEYDGGMIHSKQVVVDQRWAMVGSANMDVRSFQLNFELTCILYDKLVAEYLQQDCEQLCAKARRIDKAYFKDLSYPQTLAAGLARLATPIL
ncbi:MAG TPA: cardiolipin synthase [Phycisphaerae bacterium]|nr:cardiolipin synthase [Phycisphaerae bacterium]